MRVVYSLSVWSTCRKEEARESVLPWRSRNSKRGSWTRLACHLISIRPQVPYTGRRRRYMHVHLRVLSLKVVNGERTVLNRSQMYKRHFSLRSLPETWEISSGEMTNIYIFVSPSGTLFCSYCWLAFPSRRVWIGNSISEPFFLALFREPDVSLCLVDSI